MKIIPVPFQSAVLIAITFCIPSVFAQNVEVLPVVVQLHLDQAETTLELLVARAEGQRVTDEDWNRVFRTEGFVRVLEREKGIDELLHLDRGYSEESFQEWAETDQALEGLSGRQSTLTNWTQVDLQAAGLRAMKYLPENTRLEADVYPIVRKQQNSFVWDLPNNPAIFLAVGENISPEEMSITLAHELHHVGLAGVCADKTDEQTDSLLTAAQGWLSGFGEGLAVLAAAGGPRGPTHAPDQEELRKFWNNRLDSIDVDMRRIESFLMEVREGTLEGDDAQRRGMSFVNTDTVPQGPFYSLGWYMAVTIENELGIEKVIEGTCDHRLLISNYQRSAQIINSRDREARLPIWTEGFLESLQIGK